MLTFLYKKVRGILPASWQSHGYGISNIDLKNKKVAFKKDQKENSKLKIPEVFLTDDIPNEAKYELEQFFDYIKKEIWNIRTMRPNKIGRFFMPFHNI